MGLISFDKSYIFQPVPLKCWGMMGYAIIFSSFFQTNSAPPQKNLCMFLYRDITNQGQNVNNSFQEFRMAVTHHQNTNIIIQQQN